MGLAGILAVTMSLGRAPAQYGANTPENASPILHPHPPDEEPTVDRAMQERQMKRLREEHQKQVFTDTARLVQLATQLKAEVDQGAKPTPDVMKNMDEIGKLAKRVSDRIKNQ